MLRVFGRRIHNQAFLIRSRALGHGCALMAKLLLPYVGLKVHAHVETEHRYPFEIGREVIASHMQSKDRPLWVFLLGGEVLITSPDHSELRLDDYLQNAGLLVGEKVIDLTHSARNISVLRVAEYEQPFNPLLKQRVVTASARASLWQMAQICSQDWGLVPGEIELAYVTGGIRLPSVRSLMLYGKVWDRSGEAHPDFHLCTNLSKGRVDYPFKPARFADIRFTEPIEVFDMAFDLNPELIESLLTPPDQSDRQTAKEGSC